MRPALGEWKGPQRARAREERTAGECGLASETAPLSDTDSDPRRRPTASPTRKGKGTKVIIASMSVVGLGIFAFGMWALKRFKNDDRRIGFIRIVVMFAFFLAGATMTGGIVTAIASMFGKGGKAVGGIFSVSPTVILTLVGLLLVAEMFHAAFHNDGTITRFHMILAPLAPILLGLGALHPVIMAIGTSVSHAGTLIGG